MTEYCRPTYYMYLLIPSYLPAGHDSGGSRIVKRLKHPDCAKRVWLGPNRTTVAVHGVVVHDAGGAIREETAQVASAQERFWHIA